MEQTEDDWIEWTEYTPELVNNSGVVPTHTVQCLIDGLQDLYVRRQEREMWRSAFVEGITGTNEFWNFAPPVEHAISTGELRPDGDFDSKLCFTEEAIVSICRSLPGPNVTLGLRPDSTGYYAQTWGTQVAEFAIDEVYCTCSEPFDVSGNSDYEYELR